MYILRRELQEFVSETQSRRGSDGQLLVYFPSDF